MEATLSMELMQCANTQQAIGLESFYTCTATNEFVSCFYTFIFRPTGTATKECCQCNAIHSPAWLVQQTVGFEGT